MHSLRAPTELFGKDPSEVREVQSPELRRLLALPRALEPPQLPEAAPRAGAMSSGSRERVLAQGAGPSHLW